MATALKPKLSNILTYEDLEYYTDHLVDFVHDYILVERSVKHGGTLEPTWQQIEIMEAIQNGDRVSVRAGRGIGKTTILSWLIIWWMAMFPGPKVIATAPTFPQLQSVLWPELSKWLDKSLLKPYFTKTAKRMYVTEKGRDNSFAEPRTASKEEAAQGLHGDDLLVLVDEAPGVEDNILETIQGSFTGSNNKFLLMGNPSRTSGFFYDTHNSHSAVWNVLHYNSEDSSAVSEEWLSEMKYKYVHGTSINYIYKVHVLGEFPEGDLDALISLEDVQDAVNRVVKPEGVVEIGVDVAHKGDDSTVICTRIGNHVKSLITAASTTIPQVIEMAIVAVKNIRLETGYVDTIRVKVDSTGMGVGVVDGLDLDTTNDIEVISCNFGGSGDENYSNEASVMWGYIKDHIKEIDLPDDSLLRDELSTRRWDFDTSGRVKIEPKKQYKKDFKGSPDRADALVLAFAGKDNDRKFIKAYNYSKFKATQISREYLMAGMGRYCAIYASPTNLMSAVFCSYKSGTLAIFDTFEGTATELLYMISNYAPYTKVLGGKNLFRSPGDDIASQYSQRGLYLLEVWNYDELSAITNLDKMFSQDKIIIATECVEMMDQMRYWTATKKTVELKEKYGLCYALTYAVAERMNIESVSTFSQPMNFYSSNIDIDAETNDGYMSI